MATYELYNKKVKSEFSYFCPDCMKFASLSISEFPTATIKMNQYSDTEKPNAEIRGLDVLIKCPKCGQLMKPIDTKMVNYVKKFVIDKKIALAKGGEICSEGWFEGPDEVPGMTNNVERVGNTHIRFACNIELWEVIKKMHEELDELADIDMTNLGIRIRMKSFYNYDLPYGVRHYKLFCEKQRDFFKALDLILDALPDKFTDTYNYKKEQDTYSTKF